ncbi:MAG TPA: ECF transporter S component [Ruminococcaceae bacterium]|nr:ECF transporter S component [Oscillospiraceae bacterium]
MKRTTALQITVTGCCIAINIIGAFIALSLKLPIYLDSIGTILTGALLGPFFGIATGCLSGVISGMTSDVYAFYFMPVGAVVGLMAGILFNTSWFHKLKIPIGTLLLTIPGTIVSSCISAFVFGGISSSGSSLIIQILRHVGLNLIESAFIVQFLTDYADRLISVGIVCLVVSRLTIQFKLSLRNRKAHGTL